VGQPSVNKSAATQQKATQQKATQQKATQQKATQQKATQQKNCVRWYNNALQIPPKVVDSPPHQGRRQKAGQSKRLPRLLSSIRD